MAELSNKQWEQFCHAMLTSDNQTEAARCAGFSENGVANVGSRLMKRPEVCQRIAELRAIRESSGDSNQVASRGWIVSQTIYVHRRALKAKQYSVNLQCLQFLAKLGGYLVEQRASYNERLNIHEYRSLELNDALRGQLKQLPEAERAQIMAELPELSAMDSHGTVSDNVVDNKGQSTDVDI